MHTVDDVQNMYRKVCVDPYAAVANSRILFLRFRREEGKIVENDDEHGARRRLLRRRKTKPIIRHLTSPDESGWSHRSIEIHKYGIVD